MHRTVSGATRLAVVAATWVLVGAMAAFFLPWAGATLLGWDAASIVFLTWVWLTIRGLDPEQTRAVATFEDNSRVAASFFLLIAAVSSLAGAAFAAITAPDTQSPERALLFVISLLTVFLSWTVVQTVFTLRYAHEYYGDPEGGIDFGSEEGDPDYLDFAYVAFTVGMTFQLSDTAVLHRQIRRTVTRHALLAYFYGAVILAVMVNVIAGLVK